jgi:hypothetical protein
MSAEAIFAAAAAAGAIGRHHDAPRWALPAAISDAEMQGARLTPRCIVENYLFADVAALFAPGAASKTTMTLHEAVCIVLGRPVWGQPVHAPGPVVLLTAEDQREFLVARLRRICEGMRLSGEEVELVRAGVLIHDCTAHLRRLTEINNDVVAVADFAHEIVAACREAKLQPAVVQFDPLVSFGVGEARVNDSEQGLIHAARVIVAGLDCAVRFVHHTGQAKALDKAAHQYAGRGGSALSDGCRMVHVLTALDAGAVLAQTGERLEPGESAFALARPKISHAPPQTAPIIIRRTGYRFDVLRALLPQSAEERAETVGRQLARFIEAEAAAGRTFTRNTLEQLKPENLSRPDVRQGLAWLAARGMLLDVPLVGPDGKAPKTGARTRLAVIGEPTARRAP